jgi:hypothetical protein
MNPVQAAGDRPDLDKGCEEMAMARPFLRPISERELFKRESIPLPDCIVKPLIPSTAMAEMSVQTYLAYRGEKGILLIECSTS